MIFILCVISEYERETLNGLLVAVQGGNREALGEVYRIAGGRMLSVAMGLMRDKQLAEDVLHDSFIKVVRFCDLYKPKTNAYAWLCTIVRTTALNKIKSENLKCGINIDSFFNLSDEAMSLDGREQIIAIEDSIKKITPKERTAIWLKYYNDMTVREIATELGLARSTTQDLIKAAEKQLKTILKDQ